MNKKIILLIAITFLLCHIGVNTGILFMNSNVIGINLSTLILYIPILEIKLVEITVWYIVGKGCKRVGL